MLNGGVFFWLGRIVRMAGGRCGVDVPNYLMNEPLSYYRNPIRVVITVVRAFVPRHRIITR